MLPDRLVLQELAVTGAVFQGVEEHQVAAGVALDPDSEGQVRAVFPAGGETAGKLVTVLIEDTCCRILPGEEELAVKSRKDASPVIRLCVRGRKTQAKGVMDVLRTTGRAGPETSH
jgi:hypothetical protein